MRKDPFGVGSFVHVVKRGTRQLNIVRDDEDRWRFLKLLRYLNDKNVPRNWEREITTEHVHRGFQRPLEWKSAQPYVSIISFCLMDNHFHILLQEKIEDGVGKFMHRVCTSMSLYFNAKYQENGTLFQGAYKARVVDEDAHFEYLAAYIQVKNPFERYRGGIQQAIREYDAAFKWVTEDPFSSLADHLGIRRSPLIDHDVLREMYPNKTNLRTVAREIMHDKYKNDLFEYIKID